MVIEERILNLVDALHVLEFSLHAGPLVATQKPRITKCTLEFSRSTSSQASFCHTDGTKTRVLLTRVARATIAAHFLPVWVKYSTIF
jgi:hypothetical protein